MALPYENTTSGERALEDIRKVLMAFGCSQFGTMIDTNTCEVTAQFRYRTRDVLVKASWRGYAQAWLKEHPYNCSRHRLSKVDYERKAMEIGQVAVYSILRDWIKGQVTAVETGILQFEGAFLGQIMLPSGKTIMDEVTSRKLLPAPGE
jgi:hypothetical protein